MAKHPWERRRQGWKRQTPRGANSWRSWQDDISLGGILFRDVGANFDGLEQRRRWLDQSDKADT